MHPISTAPVYTFLPAVYEQAALGWTCPLTPSLSSKKENRNIKLLREGAINVLQVPLLFTLSLMLYIPASDDLVQFEHSHSCAVSKEQQMIIELSRQTRHECANMPVAASSQHSDRMGGDKTCHPDAFSEKKRTVSVSVSIPEVWPAAAQMKRRHGRKETLLSQGLAQPPATSTHSARQLPSLPSTSTMSVSQRQRQPTPFSLGGSN